MMVEMGNMSLMMHVVCSDIHVTEDGMQFSSQVVVEFLDLVPIVGNSFEALSGWLTCCLSN